MRPAGGSRIGGFLILAVFVEVWKFRGLEAWFFQRFHPSRACRAFCFLFSVLCLLGRDSAPPGDCEGNVRRGVFDLSMVYGVRKIS